MDTLKVCFKIGDKRCAPGKEWATVRDGMVADYYRSDGYWPTLSPTMHRVYAVIETERTDATLAAVQEAVETNEVWIEPLKPNKTLWRGRKGLVSLPDLAAAVSQSSLTDAWRGPGSVDAISVSAETFLSLLKSSSVLNPVMLDLNATTGGDVTIGPDGGDTFATWNALFTDLGNLTAALNGTQTGVTTEAVLGKMTENLAGNTFTLTSDSWGLGNPTLGHTSTITVADHMLTFECEGPGNVVVEKLRMVRTTGAASGGWGAIDVSNVTATCTLDIRLNTYDGGSVNGAMASMGGTAPIINIYANMMWDCTYGANMGSGNAAGVWENNVIYNPSQYGMRFDFIAINCRRNAVYGAGTQAFVNHSSTIGNYNYADDASVEDANWASGSGNDSSRAAGTDLESVDDTSAAFLRANSGVGMDTAYTTALAENTVDASNQAWADVGWYVGARAPAPAPVKSGIWFGADF